MNIVNITLGVDTQPCSSITLGRRGENEVTQVVVDFSSWVEEFGAGVITLLAMRSQDTSAYPVVLTLDGNTATWDVTSTDTAYKGSGRAEYIYTVGEQIAKSVVLNTVVMQDIGEPSETPPDPYEDWLERLTELGAETQANAEAAQQSAENAAQSAEDAAESAASVEGAVEQAEAARDAAMAAQAASESARDAAQTAQTNAEASATAASGSATSAAGSASDASASASAAGASATTASTAATSAQAAQSAAEDAAEDAQQAAQQAHVEYEQLSDAVDDLSDEVTQQKSAIDDLSALVDRKAGMLVDTASGAIASFVPDSTIPDLLGVSVAVEPVQDLHGYDFPWPAGGGKNKFDVSKMSNTADITVSNGIITVTGNAKNSGKKLSELADLVVGESYTLTATTDGTQQIIYLYGTGANVAWQFNDSKTITQAHLDALVFFYGGADATAHISNFMIRLSSVADATFAPYSNICPISGWDSVEVERTGVNLFGFAQRTAEVNGITFTINADGSITATGTATAQANFYFTAKNGFSIPSGDFTFSISCSDASANAIYVFGDTTSTAGIAYSEIGSKVGPSQQTRSSTGGTTGYNILRFNAGTTVNGTVYIQIEHGSTASAYHPYTANTYTIALGQTVYGGTLDVTAGTMTVEWASTTITTESPLGTYGQKATYQTFCAYRAIEPEWYQRGIDCNMLKRSSSVVGLNQTLGFAHGDASDNVYFSLGVDVNTVAEAYAFLAEHPLQFVYELSTPITIQLDPVTISTISGQTNNLWADVGDVSVEFAADIKDYIDRMNQPTEDDMIANTLIQSGKYFTVNNKLYLSTASIAAGAMIIPGTNCTETSLAAALNALNA